MIDYKVLLICLMISIHEYSMSVTEEETDEKLTEGMSGSKAELAHFNHSFGFVDYRIDHVFKIDIFLELKQDHDIKLQLWTPKLWQHMIEKIPDMKFRLCEDTLKDPLLQDNKVVFDINADEESIGLVEKEVIFFRYKRMPEVLILVRCPVIIHGQDGYYAYVTPFERTEKEGEQDFYFILLDLYYKDVQYHTDQVVVVMRTKSGERVPYFQRMKEFVKNSFNTLKRLAIDEK